MGAGNELPGGSSIPTTPNKSAVTGGTSPSYLKGFLAMALAYAAGGWGAAALVGAKFFGGAAMGPVMESFKTWMGEHVGVNTSQHFSGYIPGAASRGIDTSQWKWDPTNTSDLGPIQPGYKLPQGSTGYYGGTVGISLNSNGDYVPTGHYYGNPSTGSLTAWENNRNPQGQSPWLTSGGGWHDGQMAPGPIQVRPPNDTTQGAYATDAPYKRGGNFNGLQTHLRNRDPNDNGLGALFNAPWDDETAIPTGPAATPLGPQIPGGAVPQEEEPEEEEGGHWEGPGGLPTYTPMTFNPTFLAWQPGNTGNPQFTSGASSSSLTPEQIAALLAGGK